MKVEAEDDAGRRNEEAGDDVFQVRGSKTLADLRQAVEKYIVRPWEENKDDHVSCGGGGCLALGRKRMIL